MLRLLSEKEALKQSEAKEDEIRKASICIAGKIITEPSCNKTYYEKDKSSNVLIVDGVLKGGTPQKLVEKLLDPNICKPSTIVAFILTFHGKRRQISLQFFYLYFPIKRLYESTRVTGPAFELLQEESF